MKDIELVKKWLKPMEISSEDLTWIWRDAELLLEELGKSQYHWGPNALMNKRQGHVGEYCATLLLEDLRFGYFWKTPKSPREDSQRPYDILIAKKHLEKGNLEIKTMKIEEPYAEVKDIAWRYSEAHYVLIFEVLNSEVLEMDIQQIKKDKRSLYIKFGGWLTREKVNRKKPTPSAFTPSRKFWRREWRDPRTFLRLLLKAKNQR